MKTLLLSTALALTLAVPAAATGLIQVVIDHSGVLHDEGDPLGKTGFNRFLDGFLQALAREHRRERDATRVILISAVAPARIIWSGTAADFYREGVRGTAVQAVVAAQPNGCNNLPEALAEVATNLAIHGRGRRELHLVTSGVHTGPGCADLSQEDYAQRVEQLDPEFAAALRAAAAQLDRVTVHFLTAAQRRALIAGGDWRGLDIQFRAQGER